MYEIDYRNWQAKDQIDDVLEVLASMMGGRYNIVGDDKAELEINGIATYDFEKNIPFFAERGLEVRVLSQVPSPF